MKGYSILLIALSLLFSVSACDSGKRTPDDGVWYCEELQAKFTYGLIDTYVSPDDPFIIDESENYVIVNGDRIAAIFGGDRGAKYVSIVCQELDHPDFYCDETIYLFEFVSLSDTEYVVKDDAGKQYTFLRIGDTPTDD